MYLNEKKKVTDASTMAIIQLVTVHTERGFILFFYFDTIVPSLTKTTSATRLIIAVLLFVKISMAKRCGIFFSGALGKSKLLRFRLLLK